MKRIFWVVLALAVAAFCGLSASARAKKLQIIDDLDIKRYAGKINITLTGYTVPRAGAH